MREYLLSDVAVIDSGAGFPIVHQGSQGEAFPFLKVSDMNLAGNERQIKCWNNSVSEEVRSKLRAKAFPAGALIFPKIGAAIATNKKRQLTRPSCVDNNVMAVIPNAEYLDSDFLYYLFLTKNLSDFASDSNPPSIRKSVVEQWRIKIPMLQEQRRIVDLLSRADGIVRLRREAEKKASELIPALFLDIFGDPARNPKGWEKLPLGELCTRITDGTHQPPKVVESGIPFIFVANIVKGTLSLDAAKFISEETYLELTRRCPIEQGDVLYSTVGSYGVAVKVDTEQRFSFQRHIAHLKPRRDRLEPDFLVGMLSTSALKAQADMAARGIAQKTINLGEIRQFEVIAPPIEAQRQFAVHVAAATSIQLQQSQATAKARATFGALLAHAFRNQGSQ